MISSNLLSPIPHNERILFQINLDSRQQNALNLYLTPHNYQSQFHNFILEHKLTRIQASQLKEQIEKKLQQRVIQFLAIFKKKQLLKEEKTQYSSQNYQKHTKSSQSKTSSIQKSVQTEQLPLLSQTNQKNSITNIHRFQANTPGQLHKSQNSQQSLLHKLDQSQNFESNKPSPRFYEPQAETIQNLELGNQFHEEEDLQPRQSPDMKSIYKSGYSLNNSPQNYKSSETQSTDDKLQSHYPKSSSNKKLFLLQNYKKNKDSSPEVKESKSKQDPGSPLTPKKKIDPQIFKRLYETQTASSLNRKQQEINTIEEMQYNQYLKEASSRKLLPIQYFQDLSTKLTQSFKLKSFPEVDLREAQQVEAAKLSFKQHLQKKKEERKLRQRLNKDNKEKQKKFELRGPHCEQKQIRKKMEILKKNNDQFERKIRERIKKQKSQNIHRDLSKHSYSPASQSKYKSRVCPSCSPVKSSVSKTKIIKQPKIVPKSTNKKYVSNILKQAYQQFSSQIKS